MLKIQITEAKKIAERIGADAVVILAFDGNHMMGASYGTTKANCKIIGKWLDTLIDAVCKDESLPAPDFVHCPWPTMMQDSET